MAEPKPLASLTSGLLARKGTAQPAMRRPMLGSGRAPAVSADDLGWNDMGFDVQPAPLPVEEAVAPIGLTPMAAAVTEPPVIHQRKTLARRLAGKAVAAPAAVRARKAAFTLRLDADRHLKLRLACAVSGRSAQQIVTQALDDYLNDLPEIDRLAQQLPAVGDGQ
ncbi:hypothetical protein [Sphingobium sp. CCH11-B1]|uniref:hypothetical protein n=1 Tax=Sphingobium sp. CCH11-B1 TaxID=1768781 RepID=UPI00082DA835|nr:hypothetical protein [Sphingobium sp. CCH11-B1]